MYQFPDISGLVSFAVFGAAVALLLALSGLGWLGYHMVMALAAYFGAAA
jgi:uncharacterized membrane protein YfbV (UPF0208 family)